MTKRNLQAISVSLAAAALLLSEQAAFSADTVWDLLRRGDPLHQRAAAPVTAPADIQAAGPGAPAVPAGPSAANPADSGPSTVWDLLRIEDPAHLKPALVSNPNLVAAPPEDPFTQSPCTVWDLLRSPDPAHVGAGGFYALTGVARAANGIDPRTGKPVPHVERRHGGVVGFFDSMRHTFQKVGRALNSDLKITGNKSMGFHFESVSGSADTYSNDQYWGRRGLGGAYDQTDLTIQGKVAGIINFETRMSNSLSANPNDNRVSLNYASRKFKVDAGDITGSIVGNSLIDFSRTLKGIEFSSEVTRGLRLTGLFSQTKAQTRTVIIQGAETSGPYYVYAGQIVDGSEHVRVNNKDMIKGQDYTLDPYSGELKFATGTIIHYQDVIAVTFETYGYNQSPGTLTGWRADVNLIKGAKMGLTYLAQTSSQSGTGTAQKVNQFYGYGDPATPYVLDYPIEMIIVKDDKGNITSATPRYPVTATVGGLPQVYGTDFIVDALVPNRVYFKIAIPSTQIIKITYTPQTTNDNQGNRTVMGLDTLVPLGSVGQIVGEWASSKLSLSGGGANGGAWQIRGDTKFLRDRLHWTWNLRNIDPDFTAIESPGFRQNEKGLTMGFDYLASKALKFTATIERSKRPSYDYSNLSGISSSAYAQSTGRDDFAQANFGVNWQLGKGGQLNLTHNAMNTKLVAGGNSSYLTDSLSFAYGFKSLKMDLMLGRNSSSSLSTYNNAAGGSSGTGTTVSAYNSNALTERLNLSWRASDRFSFTSIFANSSSKSNGSANDAQDMSFTAVINPMKSMTLTLGYQLQNSGSFSSLTNNLGGSTVGGIPGTGYLGGGYNTGVGSFGNYSGGLISPTYSGFGSGNFAGRSRTANVQMNYQPWQSLTLDFTWNSSSSEGDYQYNSRRNDIGLNATYTMSDRLSIASSFTTQRVTYLGNQGGTSTNMAFFNIQSRPLKKLTANLGFQIMQTNSSAGAGTGTGSLTGTDPITGLPTTGLTDGLGSSYFGSFGGTNMTSYTLRLEYPVIRNNALFFQLDNADSSGYGASTRRTMMLGFDIPMTPNTSFEIGWRSQQNISKATDAGGTDFSYNVNSLDANFNLHF